MWASLLPGRALRAARHLFAPPSARGVQAQANSLPPNLLLSAHCLRLLERPPTDHRGDPVGEGEVRRPVTLEQPVLSLFSEGREAASPSTVVLEESVFGCPVRRDIVHDVVRWQRAMARQGTAKAKNRGEVSGSGAKVRRQKGGGTARAGDKRPPHWRGGGVAHGPRGGRDWSFKLNKKVKALGLRSVLSAKLLEGRLSVVDSLVPPTHRTAHMAAALEASGLAHSRGVVLVAGEEVDEPLERATQNLRAVKVLAAPSVNCLDLLKHKDLVISLKGLEYLQKKLRAL
jgi:large subunit ribosomal protein L4